MRINFWSHSILDYEVCQLLFSEGAFGWKELGEEFQIYNNKSIQHVLICLNKYNCQSHNKHCMNCTIINCQEYNIQQISASCMIHKPNQTNQSMFSLYHFFWAACKASTARRSGNTGRRRWWITTLYSHRLFVVWVSRTLTFWEEIKNRHISALFWGACRLKTNTRLTTHRIVWRTISISSRSLASWISSIHLGILRVGPWITMGALFQFQKGGFYNNYNIKKLEKTS